MGHWQPKHQCDADGQRDGDLKRGDAVGKGQFVTALNEIVGGVVDAGTGHEGEDTGQQEDGDRGFEGHGEDAGQQGQRDDSQQGSGKGFQPEQDGGLVDEPAHRAHEPAVGQGAFGAREEDGKAQGARPGPARLLFRLVRT